MMSYLLFKLNLLSIIIYIFEFFNIMNFSYSFFPKFLCFFFICLPFLFINILRFRLV